MRGRPSLSAPMGHSGLTFFDPQGQTRLSPSLLQTMRLGSISMVRTARCVWPSRSVRTAPRGWVCSTRCARPRLSMDLGLDEAAGVNLYGAGGILRAALAVRGDGTPGLGASSTRRARRSNRSSWNPTLHRIPPSLNSNEQTRDCLFIYGWFGNQGLCMNTFRPVPNSR